MDVAINIDEQLIAAMAYATQPPAIVRPYFDTDKEYEKLVQKVASDYEVSRQEFESWVAEGQKIRRHFGQLVEDNSGEVTAQHVDSMSQFAQILEKKAELGITDMNRRQKTMKRLVAKLSETVGKKKGQQVGDIMDATFKQWREEIDAYLDMAVFFRAMSGKHDPDQKVEFVAETSRDIDAHFASIGVN